MTDPMIIAYRAGTFTREPTPTWMLQVTSLAASLNDWDEAVGQVLRKHAGHITIEEHGWYDASFNAWHTPDGGYYVELGGNDLVHAEVWLPDSTDWLPFNASYVEPFLRTRAAIRQIAAIDRLTNTIISYARHGAGKHIDRATGESRIDEAADRRDRLEHNRREMEAARTVAAHATAQA